MSSFWRLPKLASILDPRSEAQARSRPIIDAANIPCDELPERLAELPPRSEPIILADFRDGEGREACLDAANFLEGGGRAFRWQRPSRAADFTDGRLWSPNPILETVAPLLNGKRALDLGCGAGRDSVALASAGLDVVGIDVLPEAVAAANRLYDRWRALEWGTFTGICDDFDAAEGVYDFALSVRALSPPVPAILCRSTAIGGIVAVEAFTATDAKARGKAVREHHVVANALPNMLSALAPILYEEVWCRGRHLARYIGRRSA